MEFYPFSYMAVFSLQSCIFYGISGVIERITPFGTRGSLFCTLLVASGFTALEGKGKNLQAVHNDRVSKKKVMRIDRFYYS